MTGPVGRDAVPPGTRETLLVVCRANLIRSPWAAGLLRQRLAAGGGPTHEVASAGLHADEGARPDADTVALGGEWGLDLTTHVARPATAGVVAGASLVLTMTEEQRSGVVRLAPSLTGRTFTLLELVRLLAAEEVSAPVTGGPLDGCLADLATRAHRRRPLVAGAAAPEDVPDPVGRGTAELREVAGRLARACDRLTGVAGP
ncbi:hypothetical protein [uncultured Nocardioides sp.]|uniref:arsenate reductase/protein-tyrosine-phosphatase family protein n=1 Tax=uncultured Nocardioides sp. TaxID=198441 RepID=UPI0026228F72|nr:hypothetical protein [uncultured Nocardioides sp.]